VPVLPEILPRAHLTCVDVSVRSLEVGIARFGSPTSFVAFDGDQLPFAGIHLRLRLRRLRVSPHSPEAHARLLGEMRRVLKPRGRVMIYEHNPSTRSRANRQCLSIRRECYLDQKLVLSGRGSSLRDSARQGSGIACFFPRPLRWLRGMEDNLDGFPWAPSTTCGEKNDRFLLFAQFRLGQRERRSRCRPSSSPSL